MNKLCISRNQWLLLGLFSLLPIWRTGLVTNQNLWQWLWQHSVFSPMPQYVPEELYKDEVIDMKLCQIKPASEMNANEVARTICLRNGQISWGSKGHSGTPSDVWIKPGCPEGKAIGIMHSHPKGTSEPSSQDISEMLRAKLPFLCIHGDDALSCYRVR